VGSLGIDEDVRRRNEHVEAHTTEEYWLGWYEEALQSAKEAKKTNRDFTDLAATSEVAVGVESAVGETPEVRSSTWNGCGAKHARDASS
jgi:hypothetical protein